MSDFTIRLARRTDAPIALALWQALHAEHERQDSRYRMSEDAAQRWATDFRDWTHSPGHRVWLAEIASPVSESAQRVVGLLTAHLYQPAPTFEPYTMVYVDDLYLIPAARGQGVADRMMDEVRAWADESDAIEIRAGVLAVNSAGRAFWAKQGATDFYVTVTARLG
ncbi:MAG: GNAT family N-acetyltransferase [Bacteroidota bacterium]